MKTALKLSALLLATGFSFGAVARFAGATIPTALDAQNFAGLFTAVFVGLILIKDYAPRRPSLVAANARVIVPPSHAFKDCADRLAA